MARSRFTFVCEYAGGTYVSQVEADDERQALQAWSSLLRAEQPIEGVSARIADEAGDRGAVLSPLDGLVGVWCWTASVERTLALANIVRSA